MIRLGVKLPMTANALRPNSRVHWREKAKQTRALRLVSKHKFARVVRKLKEAGVSVPVPSVQIHRKFFFKTNRRRDKDNMNASCKAINDGMVDSGLIVDDYGENIVWQDSTLRVEKEIPHEFIYYEITVILSDGPIPTITLYDQL